MYRTLMLMMLMTSNVFADEEPTEESFADHALSFVVFEGLIALNSYTSSKEPEIYGGLLTLLSPLAATSDSDVANYYAVLGAASLGLYNAFELNDTSYTENERFKKNMIAWHVFSAGLLAVKQLFPNDKTEANLIPIPGGAVLTLSHRF